ncbi:uncharacterized protein LOC129599977 [Paramacrobiotus metropolitanus]|uniref:uncharacterized protein LOC129599977 n=1 Tax=Paramacrobiotus metropolitanus TaxID=2943436 RepID=UPI002446161F|nr:uncharacterized protein LOC129599977 [Paramacrobiotus metropolitanus]XP_055354328.1 uncharacterized protein LOC129599977 [Paramacrobiotus metropolitanus]
MPLGKFLLLPIYRPEYSLESDSGLYDPFVVDILGASGALMRGYVCDVDEHGVSVQLDAHTVQHAAYGHVWSVKDPDFDESTTDLSSGDIEVRIDLQDSGVAAWTPARLVDSIRWAETEWFLPSSCGYSVVTVEVPQADATVAHYTVIDGPTALTQRLRRRGDRGPLVPRGAFQKVREPMFRPSEKYPHPVRFLQAACSFPRFHTYWLRDSHTMLLGLHDDYMELLLAPERAEMYNQVKNYYLADTGRYDGFLVRRATTEFVEGLFVMQQRTVGDILGGLVCTVLQSEEFLDDEPYFSELILEIQIFIYSNLDIFHQNLLKRVSKAFLHLLDSSIIRSCVILPVQPIHEDVGPDDTDAACRTWRWNGSFACVHFLARSVTEHCRVLCLVGEWEYCLFSLVDLLKFLSLKLKWLVNTGNTDLYINELDFPSRPMS